MRTVSKLFLLCLLLTVAVSLQSFAQAPPRELGGFFVPFTHANLLGWNEPNQNPGPLHYNVYRSGNGDSLLQLLSPTNDRHFRDTTVDIPGVYRYRVTAVYSDDA
jgi:fibronectin type 3 domain-containing protein